MSTRSLVERIELLESRAGDDSMAIMRAVFERGAQPRVQMTRKEVLDAKKKYMETLDPWRRKNFPMVLNIRPTKSGELLLRAVYRR